MYPLPVEEWSNDLYTIYVNGQLIQAHSARVSAMPFNRHWPGHQRTLDQTEVIPFISFEMQDQAEILVIAKKDFCEAVIRPLSKGIKPYCNGREITFSLPCFGQYSLELDGVKGALQIFANPPMNYLVQPGDNNTLYFGAGVHHVGTINLRDGQTVYIDASAVIFGQIHAKGVSDIRILGRGILDQSLIDAEPEQGQKDGNQEVIDPYRPSPICLQYCKNVTIEGITIRDPAFLALRPIGCENVTIDNVKIIGCWRYNSDGIDFINSVHCRVRNCYVRTFDDSLCLKGFYFLNQGEMFYDGNVYPVMNDVTFEHCVVWNDWGKALEVGVDYALWR